MKKQQLSSAFCTFSCHDNDKFQQVCWVKGLQVTNKPTNKKTPKNPQQPNRNILVSKILTPQTKI